MSNLDHSFENEGRRLIVRAEVANGWRKERHSPDAPTRKTFCFSEVTDAEWQGGTIHVQLSVFPRPSGLTDEWAAPPDLTLSGEGTQGVMMEVRDLDGVLTFSGRVPDCCIVQMSEGVLVASVDLLNESGSSPWRFDVYRNRGGHLMFERLYQYSLSGRPFSVDVQLRLTFKPPTKPAPVELSFWNEFLPGGRPESNRRKF